MASGIYNRFKANLMNKEIDLEGDVIKVALMNNSHSYSATDNTFSNTNEISGTNYTAGGSALASKAVTQASTTKWDATDLVFSNVTLTAYHAVLYDDTHAGDDLICSLDLGGAQTVTAADLTFQWDAAGIITLA